MYVEAWFRQVWSHIQVSSTCIQWKLLFNICTYCTCQWLSKNIYIAHSTTKALLLSTLAELSTASRMLLSWLILALLNSLFEIFNCILVCWHIWYQIKIPFMPVYWHALLSITISQFLRNKCTILHNFQHLKFTIFQHCALSITFTIVVSRKKHY